MLKAIATLILQDELTALKARLAEASASLDTIQAEVTKAATAAASADTIALAQTIVSDVLATADRVRSSAGPYLTEWEQKLYAEYNAGVGIADSVISRATALFEKSALLFKSKL